MHACGRRHRYHNMDKVKKEMKKRKGKFSVCLWDRICRVYIISRHAWARLLVPTSKMVAEQQRVSHTVKYQKKLVSFELATSIGGLHITAHCQLPFCLSWRTRSSKLFNDGLDKSQSCSAYILCNPVMELLSAADPFSDFTVTWRSS